MDTKKETVWTSQGGWPKRTYGSSSTDIQGHSPRNERILGIQSDKVSRDGKRTRTNKTDREE